MLKLSKKSRAHLNSIKNGQTAKSFTVNPFFAKQRLRNNFTNRRLEMKMRKSFFITLLLTLMLLLGACQPQAATSPVAPSSGSDAGSASADASPAATESAQAQDSSALFAKISELAGKVDLKQAAQAAFAPASADMQLQVNGQIQTGEDGRVRLDLSSGTIIRVAPSSLFTLIANEEAEDGLFTKIQLELGKVFIILNGGSAQVETPSGVAAVQGSYLKIEFDPDTGELTLTCLEGNCSVTTPTGETKNFTDGQKMVVHQDPQTGKWIITEGEMSPEDFQEWLDYNPEAKTLVNQVLGDGGASGGGSGGDGGGGTCFSLVTPKQGDALPFQGKVHFEWGEQSGAAKYVIKFTNANGNVIVFETADTNFDPYIEGFLPEAGEASWSVAALNTTGGEICSTTPVTFTKPDSDWNRNTGDGGDRDPSNPTCTNPYGCY
jgi:hypothetical protein